MKKAKKKAKGEQLALIDVEPENVKKIVAAARIYKKLQTTRLNALQEEIAQKQVVLNLVEEAKLQPLENGVIRFKCDGMVISVTPRDKLIKVKEQGAKEE